MEYGRELLPNLHATVDTRRVEEIGFGRDTAQQHVRWVCVGLLVHRSAGQIGKLIGLLLYGFFRFHLLLFHRHWTNIVVAVVFLHFFLFDFLYFLLHFLRDYSIPSCIPYLLLVLGDLDCHRQSLYLRCEFLLTYDIQLRLLCPKWGGFSSYTRNPAAPSTGMRMAL